MVTEVKDINENSVQIDIPGFVLAIIERLHAAGFQAYVVGGAVRDVCLNRPVTDWDVTTSASPVEIRRVFHDTGNFFLKHETVTLVNTACHYEVTTLRGDGNRVPAIEDDLAHRDFTINAMAYEIDGKVILDPYGGREDIHRRLVRAVGDPNGRFNEDPLRLLRAVRIAVELGFEIERGTMECISGMANQLASVAQERIRDELVKILLSSRPSRGFSIMRRTGLLRQILPELLEGFRKKQNKYHLYTIFRHIMETVDRVEPEPVLRLAALLHDIAKPRVRRRIRGEFRFFGHEKESAVLAREIMERLRFSNDMIKQVTDLIGLHMIGYDRKWSDGAVRRLIRRAGPENVDRLLSFRKADLMAHGLIDEKLDLLDELEKRVGELRDNRFVKNRNNLAVDGKIVMEILGLPAGPEVGNVLGELMERVTDHPELNNEKRLIELLEEMLPG